MSGTLDYWKFIAGLGFFLYGMLHLEEALHAIAGKRFKLFLKKYTTNRFLAVINGALTTALLQSSSIVLLFVIAFAGAGIISLSNSLGIILGANLGTTITGWLVASLGFGVDLQSFVYPMIGIGSLGLIFISPRFLFYHLFSFIIAVAFLFMGLDFMKEGMQNLAGIIDIQELKNFGLWAYFLFGLFVTSIIQSSSAMMTITLSAVFSGLVQLAPAMAIIVGADLGTTMTALLGSIKGNAVKKRVGLAHFFINIGTGLIAFIFIQPLLDLLKNTLYISNPLYILVAFHTSFNAIGVVLFFPFLGFFEKLLNRFFTNDSDKVCIYIHKVSVEVPEASIEAVRRELERFSKKVFKFNSRIIGYKEDQKNQSQENNKLQIFKLFVRDEDVYHDYEQIKKIEGEILEYFKFLQKEKLDEEESKKLNSYIIALRNGVQSAKAIKDIRHNLDEFNKSIETSVEIFVKQIQDQYLTVNNNFNIFLKSDLKKTFTEEFVEILSANKIAYQRVNKWIYQETEADAQNEIQIATFLNVNREIYISYNLLVDCMKEVLDADIDLK